MNEYLIQTANPGNYDPSDYVGFVKVQNIGDDAILNIIHDSDPVMQQEDVLIGAWSPDGSQSAPFDQAAYENIRPLGNNPSRDIYGDDAQFVIGETRGGDATGVLAYHHFSGWEPRQLGSVTQIYPDDNEPFDLEIRHKEWVNQTDPNWDGWGWRAEMIGDVATRDPSVHAIGVYTDPECTQFEYTTGAFVQGVSEWQVDEQGDPIEVWYTETPLGRANPTKKDWHLAVLFASLQRGYQTLEADAEAARYNFWEETQPTVPVGDEYIDTGATVISQAGTIYQISDASVAAALVVGQEIRFGDDLETVFNGVWAGGADYIQIDPFVQASIGDALWAKGFQAQTSRLSDADNGNLQWLKAGHVDYQMVPGKIWMIRWRKANGQPSGWRRLRSFLRGRIFSKELRLKIHEDAKTFGYDE